MKIPRLAQASRFAALALLGLYVSLAQAEILVGRVVKIADGDTLTVLDATKQQHRIRLTGIDAPERRQAFGTVSKQHLAELAFGREVTVQWDKRDRYQRILGKVLVDGVDANLEQVRAGLAWHYKHYAKGQQSADRILYAEAEEAASRNGVGLWRDPAPIPPWDFRRK
ncbi:thermonuclease family protein [Nitrosovibrio sp. Nv6]|uniref:thermonuclease family protein n=1 Tax=Nitrosovibrio sp. Nv6 TaxID=1855340 RepID=UPI0008D40D6A|nr:thermonuclease family protein [Nitrosovibrio sp. Nv6]SEP42837.1 Endonuclease YncB, thermonuclease family [Nitrosovibrio sp. Nv6]